MLYDDTIMDFHYVLTPEKMRRTEQMAFDLGVPSILLMEHAATAVVDELENALGGLTMLFLWKALGMSAALMEYKGELKNWFLPAAVLMALGAAGTLALTVLQPGSAFNMAVSTVSAVRDGLLAALLAHTAIRCREQMGS